MIIPVRLRTYSYGVGSVWINQLGAVCDDEKVRAMLDEFGIPSDHVVYGIAALGYAADRKSTRLNSSHTDSSRMPSSA